MVDLVQKFLGGSIALRSEEKGRIINGQSVAWTKGIVIQVGKSKVVVGKDFLKKLNDLSQTDEFRVFLVDLSD